MRAVPTATVSSPPHTAANRIATPTGRFHSQPKKWMVVDSVFCMMNTSNTIKITNPVISADHNAAARVNFTADSGLTRYSPGVATGSGGNPWPDADGGGGSGGKDGSLVMGSSLPFPASNETTVGTHAELKRGAVACISIMSGDVQRPRGLFHGGAQAEHP